MNTFLKVFLLLILAVIALKLLPFTLGLVGVLAAGLLGLIALGVSAIVAVGGAAVLAAAALSPIWVPVLVVIGIIALLRRSSGRPPTVST